MRLRNLELKDAPLMLEWMHDKTVVQNMRTDFSSKTIEDCKSFISKAQNRLQNLHLAIVDDDDTYMGTVSLKHIKDGNAEFGITVRSCAMGKGYSKWAMEQIIGQGFKDRNINLIYWCVDPKNARAIRFYEKNGYKHSDVPDFVQDYSKEEKERFTWFQMKRAEK